MEKPGNSGENFQMERFTLEEIFRKKSNTFQSITFFPFLPKRPKFSALLVPGFMSREREKFTGML